MKTKKIDPIWYKSTDEMNKPLSDLMSDLRSDMSRIRGKICDIRHAYGWKERLDFIEGGLTCMIISMHSTQEEWEKYEAKQKELSTKK
jgi:hypothetical protein